MDLCDQLVSSFVYKSNEYLETATFKKIKFFKIFSFGNQLVSQRNTSSLEFSMINKQPSNITLLFFRETSFQKKVRNKNFIKVVNLRKMSLNPTIKNGVFFSFLNI